MISQARKQTTHFSVRMLCKLFGVDRRWYYRQQQKPVKQDHDEQARQAILAIIKQSIGYGYRRVTHALRRSGWHINHKRVERLMKQGHLQCRQKRHHIRTTDAKHHYSIYPNLTKGKTVEAPNTCWIADITYIRLPHLFVYLACILDAYSRKCIGWNLSPHLDTPLALGALEMAVTERGEHPGLIHHSDRGVQYASTAYVQRLHALGACISMSAQGNCYDNAKMESFFKTLKQEEVYLNHYQTLQDAQDHIQAFLQEVYNAKRLHSSLGYLPPLEYEQLCSPVS
jgi:putative transposase